jgi:hypothetical protein
MANVANGQYNQVLAGVMLVINGVGAGYSMAAMISRRSWRQ